jgi:hypothetical protein
MKSSLSLVTVMWLCGNLVACLDFTPIDHISKSNAGEPLEDAALLEDGAPNDSVVDVVQGNQCLACASSDDDAGGCQTPYAACQALPACQSTIVCVAAGCFAGADITSCLASCEADAGTSTPGAPATVALGSLLQCMVIKCQAKCL